MTTSHKALALLFATLGPILVIPTYPLAADTWGEAMGGATVNGIFFIPMMLGFVAVVAIAGMIAVGCAWGALGVVRKGSGSVWALRSSYLCAGALTAYLVLWGLSVVIAVADWGNMAPLHALGFLVRCLIGVDVIGVIALWVSCLMRGKNVE